MTSDRVLCWCVLSHLGSTLATVSNLLGLYAEDGILQAALFAEEAASLLGN